MEPARTPMVIPNWYRKYRNTSNVLGVRSVNLLIPVSAKINALKKKTNHFTAPCMCVNFSKTNVIMVIEIASTVKNPVFTPKRRKSNEANSPGLPVWSIADSSIFSEDAKRGTLRRALIKNSTKRETDTVFT